jgi:hypothetical protein
MGLQSGGFRRSIGRIPRLSEILLSRALLRDEFWFEPYDSKSGSLFAVGQTVGQPTSTLAYTGDLAHAADATLAGIPRQRFCPTQKRSTRAPSRPLRGSELQRLLETGTGYTRVAPK